MITVIIPKYIRMILIVIGGFKTNKIKINMEDLYYGTLLSSFNYLNILAIYAFISNLLSDIQNLYFVVFPFSIASITPNTLLFTPSYENTGTLIIVAPLFLKCSIILPSNDIHCSSIIIIPLACLFSTIQSYYSKSIPSCYLIQDTMPSLYATLLDIVFQFH